MNGIYFAPIILFAVALVFSMLGRCGGTLFLPVLFWSGMDFKTEAVPLAMFLGVTTSVTASLAYGRKNMISWKIAIPFGLFMILFAPVGTLFNIGLPTKYLIVIFALFTVVSVIPVLSNWQYKQTKVSSYAKIGICGGSILGFFAGLIGRGGGSFVVPLLHILGFDIKTAAATSAFIIACSHTSSFLSHMMTHAHPQWTIWIFSMVAVAAGSQVGSRIMIESLKSKSLKWIFASVNLGIAVLLIVKDVILI